MNAPQTSTDTITGISLSNLAGYANNAYIKNTLFNLKEISCIIGSSVYTVLENDEWKLVAKMLFDSQVYVANLTRTGYEFIGYSLGDRNSSDLGESTIFVTSSKSASLSKLISAPILSASFLHNSIILALRSF